MAHYCAHQIRFKGRLLKVPLRYGDLRGAGPVELLSGKPLRFTRKELKKIEILAQRKHARIGCFDFLWE